MKTSINWLKSLIDLKQDLDALSHKLTMVGLEVEGQDPVYPPFSGVVVGHIQTVKPHPNADKLQLCTVDVGEEIVDIVCGANNVAPGMYAPVVKVGGSVGDMAIKRVKLRGEPSSGMICSERELGLSERHEGILELEGPDLRAGSPFMPEMQHADICLEVNVTPNRPDCLSHIGIARELSAAYDLPLRFPDDSVPESEETAESLAQIDILDAVACPRYTARIIRNVRIGPSPDWLKARLHAVGIRSINNVVDITNYVLMETGHPLHAFDYDRLDGRKIVVRKAEKGEKFTTLDDQERLLAADDLLICDGEKPVALAGIMGGQNSEVSEDTVDILLESAYFDPATIRATAKRLGMSTEASYRFERGADPEGTLYAVNRAARLMHAIAGGNVTSGILDMYPEKMPVRTVSLRSARISQVLGIQVPPETVRHVFQAMGIQAVDVSDTEQTFAIPSFRHDLMREIDLIEEVVRHYGYDKIAPKMQTTMPLQSVASGTHALHDTIRSAMCGMGFSEAWHSSLVSEEQIRSVSHLNDALGLKNPLSPETRYLRTRLLISLLDGAKWNMHRGEKSLRLFEIGKQFTRSENPESGEQWMLGGIVSGDTRPLPHWKQPGEPVDLFWIKGCLTALFHRLRLPDPSFQPSDNQAFQPHAAFEILISAQAVGRCGIVSDAVCSQWDLTNAPWAFEIDLDGLYRNLPGRPAFIPFSLFPAVKRDLAIITTNQVIAGDLLETIRREGGKILEHVHVFDLYRGKPLNENEKSIAFSLLFRSQDRTLKEEDVDPVFNRIVKRLKKEHHARLRT